MPYGGSKASRALILQSLNCFRHDPWRFLLLQKHETECLSALDMTQQTPTQELAVKDLHGYVWRLKHIYRGEPCAVLYHCVLKSKSVLEKMTVLEQTIHFFLPIRESRK